MREVGIKEDDLMKGKVVVITGARDKITKKSNNVHKIETSSCFP